MRKSLRPCATSALMSRVVRAARIFLKLRWRVLDGKIAIGSYTYARDGCGSQWVNIGLESDAFGPDVVVVMVGTGSGHVFYGRHIDENANEEKG